MAKRTMKALVVAAIVVVAASWSMPAFSQEKDEASVNSVFGRFGFTTQREADKGCATVMTLDRKTFIDSMPQLKAMDILNPEYVTQTRINMEPMALAMAFALEMAPTVVKELYDGEKTSDKCSFRQVVIIQDDFGNDKTETLFQFGFTRAVYSKVNWDKFQTQNLSKIASKFTFGPAMQEAIREKEAAE